MMRSQTTAQPKNAAQLTAVHSLPVATTCVLLLNALMYALQWLNPAVLIGAGLAAVILLSRKQL